MSASLQDPQDLLAYASAHRVLICRQCQYAIQKNAISSHLLRHKIYREERQRLLSHVADLDLLESEDVIIPAPGSPAIEGLAVIPGYCCTTHECGSLCASIKRMKRHQSEVHKETDLANVEAYARPVKMQTFFRGTKLRYFEVTDANSEFDAALLSIATLPENDVDHDLQNIEPQSVSLGYASSGMSGRSPSLRTPSPFGSAQSSGQGPNLNLEAMTYFRQYLTVTSFSLPIPYGEPQAWSTSVVDHALKHQWLMHGLLALSAYQLVVTCIDAEDEKTHIANGNQYASEFSNGFSLELVRQQILQGTDMSAIGDRIHQLLKCATWAVQNSIPGFGHAGSQFEPFRLEPLVETLNNLAQWSFPPRSDLPDPESIFSRAKMILESYDEEITSIDPACLWLTRRVRCLPARFSDALGRPDHVQDVLATLAAISALVISCDRSFASESKETAWHGMVGWVTMLPLHFHDMLKVNNAVALVLSAYWSALVLRAEMAGFWFLTGFAERITDEVDECLSNDQSGLRSLVQEFKSWNA